MANDDKIIQVLLKFGVDPKTIESVKSGSTSVEKALTGVSEEARQLKKYLIDLGYTEEQVNKAFVDGMNDAGNAIAKAATQAKLLQRESRVLTREVALLKDTAGDLDNFLVKPLLAVGTVIAGSIVGAAVRYISKQKEINDTTDKWYRSSQRIEKAQDRIGQIAAKTLLPYYEKLANVAENIASFIEKNPEVIETGLKVGLVSLALGTIGKAVTSGIRLYADFKIDQAADKNLLAAQLMLKAADKQITAATIENKSEIASQGSSLLKAGPLAGILSGAAIFTAIGRSASNFGAKQFGFENAEDFWKKTAEGLGLVKAASENAAPGIDDLSDAIHGLEGSQHEAEIVKAYTKLREEQAQADRDTAAERLQIIQNAANQERQALQQNAAAISQINTRYYSQIASLTAQARQADIEAEQNYRLDRQKEIISANEDIKKIEEDLAEELRKNRLAHEEKTSELIAARDALGLVKERRQFEAQQAEARRGANLEIRRRRQELAQRLQELDIQFALERQRRQEQLAQRLAELARQHAEELKQQQLANAERLKEIHANKAQELQELAQKAQEERIRRREAFIQQVRDLDASLLGERNLKHSYYNAMLNDAQNFINAYRATLASIGGNTPSTSGTVSNTSTNTANTNNPLFQALVDMWTGGSQSRQVGGPVPTTGLYRLHAGEEVLAPNTVRMAEQLMGAKFSQANLLKTLIGLGRKEVTYNDYRRFNGSASAGDRREWEKSTVSALERAFSLG